VEASFRDHGRFLRENARYAAAFNYTNDPDRFVAEIWRAGYATDPNYPNLIVTLMRNYDLYRFNNHHGGSSLSGDGRAEIATVRDTVMWWPGITRVAFPPLRGGRRSCWLPASRPATRSLPER
jgi:hypothetical protein